MRLNSQIYSKFEHNHMNLRFYPNLKRWSTIQGTNKKNTEFWLLLRPPSFFTTSIWYTEPLNLVQGLFYLFQVVLNFVSPFRENKTTLFQYSIFKTQRNKCEQNKTTLTLSSSSIIRYFLDLVDNLLSLILVYEYETILW
jgi:hypothetical protein